MKTRTNNTKKSNPSNPNPKALVTQIAFAEKQADAVAARLVPGHEPMTGAERKRVPRPKAGVRVQAKVLGDLAVQHGIAESVSLDAMYAGFDRADQLRPLSNRYAYLATLLQDRVHLEEGGAWKIATSVYSMLSRLAVDNPALASALEPITAHFRPKKKKAQAAAQSPPAAAAPPSPPPPPKANGALVLSGATFVPSETK